MCSMRSAFVSCFHSFNDVFVSVLVPLHRHAMLLFLFVLLRSLSSRELQSALEQIIFYIEMSCVFCTVKQKRRMTAIVLFIIFNK